MAFCGLERKSSIGGCAVIARLSDTIQDVVHRLAILYGFKIAQEEYSVTYEDGSWRRERQDDEVVVISHRQIPATSATLQDRVNADMAAHEAFYDYPCTYTETHHEVEIVIRRDHSS